MSKNANIPLNGVQPVLLEKTLYGFNPVRDAYIPVQFLRKAALIKYAGLVNKEFVV
jgi:hypothetical protein